MTGALSAIVDPVVSTHQSATPYAGAMAASGGRSFLASVIGWLIVAIVIWLFFGTILGTIRFIIRMFVFVLVLGALLTLYFRVRGD